MTEKICQKDAPEKPGSELVDDDCRLKISMMNQKAAFKKDKVPQTNYIDDWLR